jgi:putative nucleotidyltransferase with HDIG domain
LRFSNREAEVIVAIVSDLLRANTILNVDATESERVAAANAVQNETRSFGVGQLVIEGGTQITPADFEALDQLGLLAPEERRIQSIGQALLASIIVMVITGLYVSRFRPSLLYDEPRMLVLLAAIFILVLLGARLGLNGEINIYPTATLALLYVTIIGPEIAIIGVLGLAFLVGIMANNALDITLMVLSGGIIGALTLRRAERLNSFFFAGLMVAVSNVAVVTLFNLNTPTAGDTGEFVLLLIYSVLNGVLTAAAAMAGMYIITLLFNLPTALKLSELSQPNQPLLQRLIREAPGTYHHTLQVANLAEQAANAIGANAELTQVASLYHDIGKMQNPMFFTENQRDIGNPHDALNDPYRSADIIISHVTGGDEMAKQYRLPARIRDFIREHHGTSEVYVFYKQAVILAGDDESLVDINDFTYPGPKPQSRETAVLMLADTCEAAVRSQQPETRQKIVEIVESVIDAKRKSGQLDESGLTLNDLKVIQNIYIDMLQAVFHPRINYAEAVARVRRGSDRAPEKKSQTAVAIEPEVVDEKPTTQTRAAAVVNKRESDTIPVARVETTPKVSKDQPAETPAVTSSDGDDDAPMPEVPRLRRTGESKSSRKNNVKANGDATKSEETPESETEKTD